MFAFLLSRKVIKQLAISFLNKMSFSENIVELRGKYEIEMEGRGLRQLSSLQPPKQRFQINNSSGQLPAGLQTNRAQQKLAVISATFLRHEKRFVENISRKGVDEWKHFKG